MDSELLIARTAYLFELLWCRKIYSQQQQFLAAFSQETTFAHSSVRGPSRPSVSRAAALLSADHPAAGRARQILRQTESAIRRQNSTVISRTPHEQTFMPADGGRVLALRCVRAFPPLGPCVGSDTTVRRPRGVGAS